MPINQTGGTRFGKGSYGIVYGNPRYIAEGEELPIVGDRTSKYYTEVSKHFYLLDSPRLSREEKIEKARHYAMLEYNNIKSFVDELSERDLRILKEVAILPIGTGEPLVPKAYDPTTMRTIYNSSWANGPFSEEQIGPLMILYPKAKDDIHRHLFSHQQNIYYFRSILQKFVRVIRGVSLFNKLGYTHRDIKPANILLTLDDKYKISDLAELVKYDTPYNSDTMIPIHGIYEIWPKTIHFLNRNVSLGATLGDLRKHIHDDKNISLFYQTIQSLELIGCPNMILNYFEDIMANRLYLDSPINEFESDVIYQLITVAGRGGWENITSTTVQMLGQYLIYVKTYEDIIQTDSKNEMIRSLSTDEEIFTYLLGEISDMNRRISESERFSYIVTLSDNYQKIMAEKLVNILMERNGDDVYRHHEVSVTNRDELATIVAIGEMNQRFLEKHNKLFSDGNIVSLNRMVDIYSIGIILLRLLLSRHFIWPNLGKNYVISFASLIITCLNTDLSIAIPNKPQLIDKMYMFMATPSNYEYLKTHIVDYNEVIHHLARDRSLTVESIVGIPLEAGAGPASSGEDATSARAARPPISPSNPIAGSPRGRGVSARVHPLGTVGGASVARPTGCMGGHCAVMGRNTRKNKRKSKANKRMPKANKRSLIITNRKTHRKARHSKF